MLRGLPSSHARPLRSLKPVKNAKTSTFLPTFLAIIFSLAFLPILAWEERFPLLSFRLFTIFVEKKPSSVHTLLSHHTLDEPGLLSYSLLE